jgi:hypothetical protein
MGTRAMTSWHEDLKVHLREIAIKADTTFDEIAPRVAELLVVATDQNSSVGKRLDACFFLEPYEVFPQGFLPNAPSMEEYEDFVKAVAVELGVPQRYRPLKERMAINSRQLTLEQLLESIGEKT